MGLSDINTNAATSLYNPKTGMDQATRPAFPVKDGFTKNTIIRPKDADMPLLSAHPTNHFA